jgi:hypothetical protein
MIGVRRPLVDDDGAHGGEMKVSGFFLSVLALVAVLLPWRAGADSSVAGAGKAAAGTNVYRLMQEALADKHLSEEEEAAITRQYFDEHIIRNFGPSAGNSPTMRTKIARMFLHQLIDSRGPRLSEYDEIIRRYGEDDDPAVRAIVAETLVEKARRLKTFTSYEHYIRSLWFQWELSNGESYAGLRNRIYKQISPVFAEIERRFAQNETAAIKYQYVRSLVEKGRLWNTEDPEKEISIYDEIVQRFGDDKSPEVRTLVIATLLRKAEVLWQTIPDNIVDDELVTRFEKQELAYFAQHLQACPQDEVQRLIGDGMSKQYDKKRQAQYCGERLKAADVILDKCGKYNIQDAVAFYKLVTVCDCSWLGYPDFDKHRLLCIAQGNDKRFPNFQVWEPSVTMQFKKRLQACRARDTRRIVAAYDEIERRFEENSDHETQRKAIDVLLSQCRKPDLQEVSAVYGDIVQRFGEDKSPIVQEQVGRALSVLFAKGEEFVNKGNFDAAMTVYGELERHLERLPRKYSTTMLTDVLKARDAAKMQR